MRVRDRDRTNKKARKATNFPGFGCGVFLGSRPVKRRSIPGQITGRWPGCQRLLLYVAAYVSAYVSAYVFLLCRLLCDDPTRLAPPVTY